MIDGAQIARTNPETTVILDHCGLPYDENKFDHWKSSMSIMAKQSNVYCKISGLVMFQHQWTRESLRPYIEFILQLFGTRRSMFASNFPADKLQASFDDLFTSYIEIAKQSGLTEDEMKQVFCDNAVNVYKL